MATANVVFAGFRRLSRSAKFAFGKDLYALGESRKALKAEFVKNCSVTDPNEIGMSCFSGILTTAISSVLSFVIVLHM